MDEAMRRVDEFFRRPIIAGVTNGHVFLAILVLGVFFPVRNWFGLLILIIIMVGNSLSP